MRRFLRFRLSTLLLAIVCCALALAWWGDRERLQRELEEARTWRQVLRDVEIPRSRLPHMDAEMLRQIDVLIRRTEREEQLRRFGIDTTSDEGMMLERLAALLDDDRAEARQAAAYRLGKLGSSRIAPDVLRHLHRALQDGESAVRSQAVDSLEMIGSPEAISLLREALDAGAHADTSLDILDALDSAHAAVDPVAKLRQFLQDADADVRRRAVRRLGERPAAEVRSAQQDLIAMLHDDDPAVRSQAAQAVANVVAADTAVPALLRAYRQEEEAEVRRSLAGALARIEVDQARPR